MGLETGTYIDSLNASNPVGATDAKSQGDDHIRLLKSTILATLPNLSGAMTLTHTQLNEAAIKNEANTFTEALTLSMAAPLYTFTETDGAADAKHWWHSVDGGTMSYFLVNDAADTFNAFMSCTRVGAVASLTQFYGTDIYLHGNAEVRSGGSLAVSDAGNTDSIALTHNGTSARFTGVNTSTLQLRGMASGLTVFDSGNVENARLSHNATDGVLAVSAGHLKLTAEAGASNVRITDGSDLDMRGGGVLQVRDATNADYMQIEHQGNLGLISSNANNIRVDPATGLFYVYNTSNHANLRLYHSTGGGYLQLNVDGTNGNISGSSVTRLNNSLKVLSPNDNAEEWGYKGVPWRTENGNYTFELVDCGFLVRKNGGGGGETYTIPADSSVDFPVGSVITIANNGGGTLTIAITTDTLTWAGTGGTTGSRVLADASIAVITKVASAQWFITGAGLS